MTIIEGFVCYPLLLSIGARSVCYDADTQRLGGGPFVLLVVALPGGLDLPLLAMLPAGLGRLLVTGLGGLGLR